MKNTELKFEERYFCKWTHGAKEYFETSEEAENKAKSHYVKKDRMTDDNFTYWKKQKFTIGKEFVITQILSVVEHKEEVNI